jgi:DNA-binding transcriptional LysR family regulator
MIFSLVIQIRIMNWSDLRAFLAVAQTGSLRQAAERLQVAQPTVSRRLQNLERDLGVALFDRARDGHRLTQAGADLLPEVRAVETAALSVERRSIRLAKQQPETVRVGAGETSAAVLARGLSRLRDGPTVELVVADKSAPVDARPPDIRLHHAMPSGESGLTRRVGSVGSALYGSARFAEGRALPLSDADVSTLPWLGFIEEQEHYITMRWLREVMRERPPSACLMNSDLMAAAAASGAGVAVLPCFKGDSIAGLTRLSQEIAPLRADYWTLVPPTLARTAPVRIVLDWILECFLAIDGATDAAEAAP